MTLIALLVAGTAHAQDATVEVVDTAFSRWIKEHSVQRATLAVAHDDRLVLVKGYGGASGERRGLIASLSKAITAACATTLIQQGKRDAGIRELRALIQRHPQTPEATQARAKLKSSV